VSLRRNLEILAISTGVPAENAVVCEDGDVVDLVDGRARKVGRVDASYIFVDGSIVGDITESISDRLILGEEGFISVVAVVNLHTRSVIGALDINARGFAEAPSVFDAVREQILADLQQALDDGVDDVYRLQQVIRRTIGAWVSRRLRRRVPSRRRRRRRSAEGHLARSRISRRRKCLVALSGRVSMMETRSPTPASLFSSWTLTFLERRRTLPYRECL